MAKMKISRTSLYNLINSRLFPRPVKLHDKISIWVDAEVEKIMAALYQNMGEEEIRNLVQGIEESRSN